MEKIILIDSHVHIYPHYNIVNAVKRGIKNLEDAAEGAFKSNLEGKKDTRVYEKAWLLTERSDCNFFQRILKSPDDFKYKGLEFLPGDRKEMVSVLQNGKPILYILPGRQIVTREGLEILSLASTFFQKDREKSISEIIKGIIDSGGIAVLNWAPGKWCFSRGRVVRRVLEEFSPGELFIGDTPLRNTLWPTPRLMIRAAKRGFRIIAGSDPLPFNGEERYIGSYAFFLKGRFDNNKVTDSILTIMKGVKDRISLIGNRNNLLRFCNRQFRIMIDKRFRVS